MKKHLRSIGMSKSSKKKKPTCEKEQKKVPRNGNLNSCNKKINPINGKMHSNKTIYHARKYI